MAQDSDAGRASPRPCTKNSIPSICCATSTLLKPVGASTIKPGGFGSDIEPLTDDGVPALGEETTMAHYFDWHHTEADTLDKVDPIDFRKNVASLAVMAYVLADMPEKLVGHRKTKGE